MSLYPAYSVLALLAAFVVLIPLPWHLQALNSGTCLYMIWTALACLNYGVNTIVWRSTVIDYAPVWCDICGLFMPRKRFLGNSRCQQHLELLLPLQ